MRINKFALQAQELQPHRPSSHFLMPPSTDKGEESRGGDGPRARSPIHLMAATRRGPSEAVCLD